ncbi:M20 family metallopeptidase [Faecalispora jeddahensis]|uniref:M20 family metallopeptidase n=1 Tax=Faecalispora jeddahensis TaxID=1414721 RepID=UPI001898A5D3|nr:M20 family metallopeptidase [Faecalispora jeddahensis]
MKQELDLHRYLAEIDEKAMPLRALSDQIWEYAETQFEEFQSADALCTFLEKEGFTVERGAFDIKTAFTATFGSGSPKIGILGEFDALSGLNQEAGVVRKESDHPEANGHGCGHNLLGVGSVAAALAVKKYLEDGFSGTVAYFGCPGEEGGSGKAYMARAGAFSELDCALTWHPSSLNMVYQNSSLANFQVQFTFHGISAHAAGSPEMGRSALDALELMNVGANFLREHMIEKARIHYAVTNTGGYSPNVVQNLAKAIYLVRAPRQDQALELLNRVKKIAEGAALMTETTVEHQMIKSCANMISNQVLEQVMFDSLTEIGTPGYTPEEYELTQRYAETAPKGADRGYMDAVQERLDPRNKRFLLEKKADPLYDFIVPYEPMHLVRVEAGSTDVGDVSWMCPTAQLYAATWAPGTPGHSWQVVSQGKSSHAHKGMLLAGKVIALTAMRLMQQPELLEQAKEEHTLALQGQTYLPIPDEIHPVPLRTMS